MSVNRAVCALVVVKVAASGVNDASASVTTGAVDGCLGEENGKDMSVHILDNLWDYLFANYSEFQGSFSWFGINLTGLIFLCVVATIGTFVLHEVVYFAIYLPYLVMDCVPYFHRWKIQKVM